MSLFTCAFCPEDVNPKGYGIYTKHLGWAPQRSQGVNQFKMTGEVLGYAHSLCMDEQLHHTSRNRIEQAPDGDVKCFFCGDPITEERGLHTRRIGWALKRKGGGNNRVALPSEPMGWAHGRCLSQQKTGGEVSWDQESLF